MCWQTKYLVCLNLISDITCVLCWLCRHYHGTCHTMGLFISWIDPDFIDCLNDRVRWLQGQVFARSTRLTYASQRKLYFHVCNLSDICPVRLSQDDACRYIAFLSQRLAYNSIKQYINVVRILHLEAGLINPFHNCWQVPFFTYPSRRGWLPLTVNIFQEKLQSFLARLDLNPSDYSGHSFRHGGASFVLECGLPTEAVKAQGDWTSNAYERYIHCSWDMRKRLAATLGNSIR